MQEWAESVTSGQTLGGRILVVFMFLANVLAQVIYVRDTYAQP